MEHVYLEPDRALLRLSRKQLQFPLALKTPKGFRVEEPRSWPTIDGRLEFVEGELRWTPPCSDYQQDVSSEVVRLLGNWSVKHQDFVVAGNEAGMILGGEARGADAAIWRKADAGPHRGTFRRVPPTLAVEVAGEDEDEAMLREKASWYLSHGVRHVWLVFPRLRQVLTLTVDGEHRVRGKARLPAMSELPGLRVIAQAMFRQL